MFEENEKIVAGLIGQTHGNWLTIKYLWVAENLRGQHIGTELLEQAEKIAKERGCCYCFLDTFSFQAPQFFTKVVLFNKDIIKSVFLELRRNL